MLKGTYNAMGFLFFIKIGLALFPCAIAVTYSILRRIACGNPSVQSLKIHPWFIFSQIVLLKAWEAL
jgi:hypothetical protein